MQSPESELLKKEQVAAQPRKVYEKPKLEVLGDVRGTVLGGTPGYGESGISRWRIRP
jgi:hypothetical protein